MFLDQVSVPQNLGSIFQNACYLPSQQPWAHPCHAGAAFGLTPKPAHQSALEILTFKSLSPVFILAKYLVIFYLYIFLQENMTGL